MINKTFKRFTVLAAIALMLLFPLNAHAADRLQDTGDKLVIVIDPGHGGDNRGTLENNHEEKFMTMTTAMAMYDELLKYDGVEVYLTRTEDVKMSLKERAEFAASVDADLMLSIHYNASENHELFGSEVWVSSVSPYNGYGLQFGYEFLTEAKEMGLLIRGVKTRLGDHGDYYGIIRESVELGFPALIIEHCHVDNDRDTSYCDSNEDLVAFGIADATAVARYFGLSSSELGVDHSAHSLIEASATSLNSLTRNDDTEPDFCEIALASEYDSEGRITINVTAADYDSPLMYYSYSLDGGATFSRREVWPGCDTLTGTYTDSFQLELEIPADITPEIILRAYNPYDLYTESNPLKVPQRAAEEPEGSPQASLENQEPPASGDPEAKELPGTTTFRPALSESVEEKQEVSLLSFLQLCLVFVILLFIAFFISQYVTYQKRRKRRRQRRKEPGDNRDQQR
ncbi:MAG: N-acetylmuramoyl-L-alanine amidase [Eubacterium sp.]|nr:N-acetylmuramoyl-L-alanine amidase [Eubacterium sp.]MCM1216138.1 N-acetylmuramoyl-L-alanine amidase [Lachnospiraceae bacterium]MCM1239090.1 N-acetylmuramoyl-L-alanine amidase [Lachnospiraceae bacterium]